MKIYHLYGFNEFSLVDLFMRVFISIMLLYQYAQLDIPKNGFMIALGVFSIYWIADPLLNSFTKKRVIEYVKKHEKM